MEPFDVSANVTFRKCMLCLVWIVAGVDVREELHWARNGTHSDVLLLGSVLIT